MARFRGLVLVLLTVGLLGCKKQVEVEPEIAIEQVFVELVKSNQIDINYKLSSLGYQETGVVYFKKQNPTAVTYVNAVRIDGRLKLAMQNLEANTDYVFKVFFKQNDERKTDTKEYSAKTLAKEASNFGLLVKSTSINYDESGNFTTDLEGTNLNNLNLTELEIKVGGVKMNFGYPVLISGNTYKITINGVVNPINNTIAISCSYQTKEILFQSVPFVFNGDRYWLTYKATNFRGYYASAFNNELYYFYDNQVFKWNDAEQRMVSVGVIQSGTILPNTVGLQYDGQFFFPPSPKTTWPNPKDLSDFYNYPEAYSFNPGTGKWTSFPFNAQIYPNRNRIIKNANYFIHKDELYLTYSLADEQSAYPGMTVKTDNFLYHYNKATKQFESAANFTTEILYYQFVSINNQMYLSGLVPVYDQGFKLSATFAVFRVSDNFAFEEIYKGGTLTEPLSIIPKYVTPYEQKILIGLSTADFLLFDPSTKQLAQVYLKNQVAHTYFNGFFTFNNKLHLNADLMFTSQKIYEISIVKGR